MEEFITKNGTKIKGTPLVDCYIVEPNVHGDHRGWFMEFYSERTFLETGLNYHFVQGNRSFTACKNTIRGLHFQTPPTTQAKLVECTRGAVDDVVVDLRIGSPTYKEWIMVRLDEKSKRQLLVPEGFAHGFITRTDNAEFNYQVNNFYSGPDDACILWNDPEIGVDWGLNGVEPILSDKDTKHPVLSKSKANFYYNKHNF